MKFKTELSRKLHDSVVFDLKKDLVKLEGNLKKYRFVVVVSVQNNKEYN